MKNYQLGFLGAGNMAQAIIKGVLSVMPETQIAAAAPDNGCLDAIRALKVASAVKDNRQVAANSRYIILAVKPDVAVSVMNEIADVITMDTVIISIMAGVTINTIRKCLPIAKGVVRTMPNMAAKVGKAATGIAYDGVSDEEVSYIKKVFGSFGEYVEVDEDLLSAVTALSGSGTAYVYYFMKAIIDEACSLGLNYESARKLAAQTFAGAAEMAIQSSSDLSPMIEAVCSKGGTTIAAINAFESANVAQGIRKGVRAAYDRSIELAAERS